MESSPQDGSIRATRGSRVALPILALGIVFGDIGTSPLYAFGTAMRAAGGSAEVAVGTASLIIWTLIMVVMVKYGTFVLRASYHGEGGIFALFALLREHGTFRRKGGVLLAGLLVFGAALLFGDGAITPAISVLSAVEGIGTLEAGWARWAMPVSLGILTALFVVQRLGTGSLGFCFGPVMLLWFVILGFLGGWQIWQEPKVFEALHPLRGLALLFSGDSAPWLIVGAVVLAVTGAEALYADLGHFGRPAILHAWRAVVFPALILNYLGQAALVMRLPETASHPNLFFFLAPAGGAREALIVLATAATVIASQALISGVFSLTSQAIDLGYLPRLLVRHTSASTRGQIYVPVVNYSLGAVCLLLVLTFRTSDALANAYGVAVTGAMVITSVAFAFWVVDVWKKPRWVGALFLVGFLAVDLPLFLSCFSKILSGGIVPLLLAAVIAMVMKTWFLGRSEVHRLMYYGAVSPEQLSERLVKEDGIRTPTHQVYVVRRPVVDHAVACILEQHRRVGIMPEKMVILLLNPSWQDPFATSQNVELQALPGGLWMVRAEHGFMIEPDVPAILREVEETYPDTLALDPRRTFFVIAHEMILPGSKHHNLPGWQCRLYALMSRNVLPGADYLKIPPSQLIMYNWSLEI
jgi:KUP system potassium uptake protein